MSTDYDKAAVLKIHVEDLIKAVFKKTGSDKIAYRICTETGEPIEISFGTTFPKATVIEVADKETKKDHTFQTGAKKFLIRCEKAVEIKYNYDETDYDAGTKLTITSGGFLLWDNINLPAGQKIFFETDKDNVDVEITEWT